MQSDLALERVWVEEAVLLPLDWLGRVLGITLRAVRLLDVGLNGEAAIGGALLRRIARALERMPGAIAVVTLQHGIDLGVSRPIVRISRPLPSTATRRRLWDRALAELPAVAGQPRAARRSRDTLPARRDRGSGALGTSRRHGSDQPHRSGSRRAQQHIAERTGPW